MIPDTKHKPYLTPTEVAEWMMVSPITVRGWAQRGLLRAEITPGGHRRFRWEDVERFARHRGGSGQRGLRILIVDDDLGVTGFLRELLEGMPMPPEVETASDGFEAGRRVNSFAPDVILLDLMMPGINGLDVCRQIKQDPGLGDVRIIALSGHLTPEIEAELLATGAECCLSKPIDTRRLLAAIGIETTA